MAERLNIVDVDVYIFLKSRMRDEVLLLFGNLKLKRGGILN